MKETRLQNRHVIRLCGTGKSLGINLSKSSGRELDGAVISAFAVLQQDTLLGFVSIHELDAGSLQGGPDRLRPRCEQIFVTLFEIDNRRKAQFGGARELRLVMPGARDQTFDALANVGYNKPTFGFGACFVTLPPTIAVRQ